MLDLSILILIRIITIGIRNTILRDYTVYWKLTIYIKISLKLSKNLAVMLLLFFSASFATPAVGWAT